MLRNDFPRLAELAEHLESYGTMSWVNKDEANNIDGGPRNPIIAYTLTGVVSDALRRKYAFALASAVGTVGFVWFLWLLTTGSAHVGADFWAWPTFWALMLCAGAAGGFGVLGVWMSEFFPTRVRSTGSSASYYVGRGLGAGIFPLFALSLAGTVPFALALGIIGPVAGLVFSVIAPDRNGRAIADLE